MDIKNKKIAIYGGGVMGRGLTQLVAQSGFAVSLFNRLVEGSEKSKDVIEKQIQKAVDKGRVEKNEQQNILDNISYTTDEKECLSLADLVLENLPENSELKIKAFKKIAPLVSESCVIASNTSSLSLSKMAEASGLATRLLGLHFFNPPYAMKLLEIVQHDKLAEGLLDQAQDYGRALGRDSIVVADVAGFATSRLSVCIGLEAIRMLEAGVAQAADIDKAMELGYRHPMGPLKLGDYVGLDVRLKVAEHLYAELGSEVFKPPELLKVMVKEGRLGKKSGQGFYKY